MKRALVNGRVDGKEEIDDSKHLVSELLESLSVNVARAYGLTSSGVRVGPYVWALGG